MIKKNKKKAVVLLSGGLDSAVVLYLVCKEGYLPLALTFFYGQRHQRELKSARRLAESVAAPWQLIKIKLPWQGSALLDKNISLPRGINEEKDNKIPSTYVPGRNLIFLSFALSYAEAEGAEKIFIGAHSYDYAGYPDCRKEFFDAFSVVAQRGTKAGLEGRGIEVCAPLLYQGKAEIIKLGQTLKVPFGLTWSCYHGGRYPCGSCSSCYYRAKGFKEAGIIDPLLAKDEGKD